MSVVLNFKILPLLNFKFLFAGSWLNADILCVTHFLKDKSAWMTFLPNSWSTGLKFYLLLYILQIYFSFKCNTKNCENIEIVWSNLGCESQSWAIKILTITT